jgi:hypothetical protein
MSVAGKWRVTMPTPIGTLKFVWDIVDNGGTWRGQMSGEPPIGNSELTGIQVNGETIGFATTVQSPMGALQVSFKGTAADTSMTGVCNTRFGDNSFTAVRI